METTNGDTHNAGEVPHLGGFNYQDLVRSAPRINVPGVATMSEALPDVLRKQLRVRLTSGSDYHAWLLEQARALHSQDTASIDWDGLAEELESMAAIERRELKKHLTKLLAHLLKWSVQSNAVAKRGHSWRNSIRVARNDIQDLLSDSPGLKGRLNELLPVAYERARDQASEETGINLNRFPEQCPWPFEQFTDKHFFPAPTKSDNVR